MKLITTKMVQKSLPNKYMDKKENAKFLWYFVDEKLLLMEFY